MKMKIYFVSVFSPGSDLPFKSTTCDCYSDARKCSSYWKKLGYKTKIESL